MNEIMHLTYTYDGDTLGAFRNSDGMAVPVRLRLAFIDAPEMDQSPWGIRARAYLRSLLYINEPLVVTVLGTDKYGRYLSLVQRRRDYGNIGLRMVYGGYAALWQCPKAETAFQAAQDLAQFRRSGIWSIPGQHQTPWLYRHPTS